MTKDWIFLYKLPDVGYAVKFSDSVLGKLKELGANGLDIEVLSTRSILLTPKMNDDYDMNIRIKSGPKQGYLKTALNSRQLHRALASASFVDYSEIEEQAYGYRLNMIWFEHLNGFVVK